MSPCSIFIISYENFQHLTNFLNISEVLNIKLKLFSSSSSFVILILIIVHDLKFFLENVHIYVLLQAVTRYCLIYFGISPKT